MFEIKESKTFMDSVHGYITVPKCFIENLIDTKYFQRLRNIDQTGMRILYPNARHDRFSHSLGVFYLGQKAVDALLENFLNDPYWNISSDNSKFVFWAKNKVLFLIACLLHDIGHTPFSHSLEEEVIGYTENNNQETKESAKIEFTNKLAQLINENELEKDGLVYGDIQAAPHEQLGSMLILSELKNNIEKIYDYLISIKYPNLNTDTFLFAEHYANEAVISKDTIDDDICFIVRMILGLKYKSYLPEKQIRNCFIELLNGGNFDVDKLDYIVRDTQMSGISNVAIDIERLLNSLCIVTKTLYWDKIFKNKQIKNVTVQCIDNLQDVTSGQLHSINIKGKFSGVLVIYEDAEVIIKSGSTFVSLIGKIIEADTDTEIQYIHENKFANFSSNTTIIKSGTEIKGTEFKVLSVNNVTDIIRCRIKNATLINGMDFVFKVIKNKVQLTINGFCDISIKGRFISSGNIRLFDTCILNGSAHKILLLGNAFNFESTKNKLPSESSYNIFSVGFKKQAINIISNVLEARNYLYLWIYTHHKVIYYANFLIPAIVNSIFSDIGSDRIHWWKLNYEDISYLDDGYCWTIIKYYSCNSHCKDVVKCLCDELLSRNYKRSLYKSLAEYDLLFESFSHDQKLSIRNHFSKCINENKPFVKVANEYHGGYIDSFLINLQKEDSLLQSVSQLVFVDASYKYKRLDITETFLLFNDNTISPMGKIPLLKNMVQSEISDTAYYFYLYYECTDTQINQVDVVAHLKNAIKNFFYKMFEQEETNS